MADVLSGASMIDGECADDERPASFIKTESGGSTSAAIDQRQTIDNSRNKRINEPLPWIAMASLLAGMGFAFGLMGYIAARDEKADRLQDRGELLSLINASENRVIADNQKKQTSFALLDNDYRKVLLKLEAQENSHAK